jgi:hypothetical protein
LNVPTNASARPLLSGLYAGVVIGTKPSSCAYSTLAVAVYQNSLRNDGFFTISWAALISTSMVLRPSARSSPGSWRTPPASGWDLLTGLDRRRRPGLCEPC